MNHTPLHDAVLLQVFVAVTALTGLILAAVINERDHIGEEIEVKRNSERKQIGKGEIGRASQGAHTGT